MKKQKVVLIAGGMTVAAMSWASEIELPHDSVYVNLQQVEVVGRADARTPIAYTNLRKSELESRNDGRDIPYLLSMTPSVITTSDAGMGMGYTSMRVRGSDGSRINVTANGVPINNPESHNVYWVNMPDLVSSLRDIQIQRGVGTSSNGAGAFGASINMQTDLPAVNPYGEFSSSYGSYNTYKETLRAGTGLIGGHWSADMRLSMLGSDGYIDRAKSRLWSYFGQLGFVSTSGDTRLRLLAFGGKEKTYMAWDYASREEIEKYGRRYNPCGEYTDDNGNVAYYPDQNDNYIQHHIHLLLNQRLADKWSLSSALFFVKDNGYYEQYKTRRYLVEYGLNPFIVDGEKVSRVDLIRLKKNDNSFGGGLVNVNFNDTKFKAEISAGFNSFFGKHFGQVMWVRNYVGPINPLQEYYRNNGHKSEGNIAARGSYNFLPTLSVYADLQLRMIRYTLTGVSDTYNWNTGAMDQLDVKRNYNFFNPKVGVNWEPAAGQRLFASWSVAHREPTRDNFTDGDRNMPPHAERLFDYELGYQFTNRVLTLGANLYYMDYKDQLVLTGQLTDTGNAMTVNVPKSYRMGIELQAAYRPVKWFEWQFNTTWSRNRIKDYVHYIYDDDGMNPIKQNLGSTPIAFSPDLTLNTSFNFKYSIFEASLWGQYVTRQYMTNAHDRAQSLDPYFVGNLSLNAKIATIPGMKELWIGFNIYNLFNAKYENNGYAGSGYYLGDDGKPVIYTYAGYAVQAPTNVVGTLTFKF